MEPTHMLSQYPPGTTGHFTVKYDGSVDLQVNLPKPRRSRPDPTRQYLDKGHWLLDITGMSRENTIEILKECGAMWGFVTEDGNGVHFACRPNHGTHGYSNITATDANVFQKAVADADYWNSAIRNKRVINVYGVGVP